MFKKIYIGLPNGEIREIQSPTLSFHVCVRLSELQKYKPDALKQLPIPIIYIDDNPHE